MPLVSSKGMQNVNLAEGEESDNEVMVIEDSPTQNERARFPPSQENPSLEDQQQDDQLRELGLFEEGMTKEQKLEILQVIAMSRQTAAEEDSRRKHVHRTTTEPPSYEESSKYYQQETGPDSSSHQPSTQEKLAIEPLATDEEESRSSEGSVDEQNHENAEAQWFEETASNSPLQLKRPEEDQVSSHNIVEEMPYFTPAGQNPSVYYKKIQSHMDEYRNKLCEYLEEETDLISWKDPIDKESTSINTSNWYPILTSPSPPNLTSGDSETMSETFHDFGKSTETSTNQIVVHKRPPDIDTLSLKRSKKRFKKSENRQLNNDNFIPSPQNVTFNNSQEY